MLISDPEGGVHFCFYLILGEDFVECLLGPFDENFEGSAKMVNTIHKFKRATAFSKCLKNHYRAQRVLLLHIFGLLMKYLEFKSVSFIVYLRCFYTP